MEKIYDALIEVGLTTESRKIPFFSDEPKFHNFYCEPNLLANKKYEIQDVFGQGYDSNPKVAKIKAVGEALERLCQCNPGGTFLDSKYKNQKNFIKPSSFFCYSEEQVPNKEEIMNQLDSGTYRWVLSKNLTTGEEIYIPAQVIFLSDNFNNEYNLRKEQISTGAALGKIGEKRAFKSGFLESIERDGVMGFYLQGWKGRKIKDFSKSNQKLIDYLVRYNLKTHIFDATSDLKIPTIFALTLDKTGIGNAVSIGSKTDLNYKDAIKGAIMESIQCRRLDRIAANQKPFNKIPKESEIHSLEDRSIYWSTKESIENLNYLINEEPKKSYQKIKEKSLTLNEAVQKVRDKNFQIIETDITLPEVKKQGFEVLKITIPELHPMFLDEGAKSLESIHYGKIKNNPKLKPHPVT